MSAVLGRMKEAYEEGNRLQVFVEYLSILDAVLLAVKTDLGGCDVEYMREVLAWQTSLREKCHALYRQLVGNEPKESIVGLMNELEAAIAEGKEKYDVQVEQSTSTK